ncbi:pitrilysin family protein [Porphyromonas sp. COT-290 OH3588]|uniref:M16 family metallopeptidase n=1 Tax=Porphyromonas sp. COT-290 OH3588 TaxID=1515617 RepID=UPI00052DC07D|nr:insulinase family protein [Porphyromonas sp. COT-290 OH3588]KGO00221.1 hypothetical protein HQ48_06675 [Porphyromonas sp. COT-290 OH3588]
MKKSMLILTGVLTLSGLSAQEYKTLQKTDPAGYKYEEVTDDPTHTRVYTLENGLTVYLSRNPKTPRIQTYIPVRAGSNHDPADNTGLAHYLEHMLFKGTSRLGALNWEKERVELKKISDLYEQHKASSDSLERRRLYHQIDSISTIAAGYVSANEYDRLTTSIGAQGTNAHTWVEETVYKNDIPANELERWLQIESERFGELVLRLFHTEIEAVYEEFNMGQDRISSRVFEQMGKALFPTHPYGQQTTIGTSEHLKSPSLEAIERYFYKYYVPNNYAIVLVGDLEYDKAIALVDKYFGKKPAKPLEHPKFARELPIAKAQTYDVYSKDPEYLFLAYRLDGGTGSMDAAYLTLVDMILANGKAGLIDLDLNQAQQVMQAGSSPMIHKEYSVHQLFGMPKQGQTLEQVRELLLAQIERIKQGDFPEWLIEATINDLELQKIRATTEPNDVATEHYTAFIHGQKWGDRLKFIENLRKIKKADLVEFVKKHYADNHVTVYKRIGENKDLIRVQNPGITPLELDRSTMSTFGKELLAQQAPRLNPLYIDYQKEIKRTQIGKQTIEYIINPDNDLFELTYLFDMGQYNDKKLDLAIQYLGLIGTDKLTPQQIRQEFYKLGVSYSVRSMGERMQIILTGLKRNMDAGIRLLEDLLRGAKPDQAILDEHIAQTIKAREDNKKSSQAIFRAEVNYAMYGEHSPQRDIIPTRELKQIKAAELTNLIKGLMDYKHRVFYYGNDVEGIKKSLKRNHKFGTKDYPKATVYQQQPTGGKIYYADYDMVQAQMMMLRRVAKYDAKEMALSSMFNAYFGEGMSSIVFQEIREAKSLAYSAYAYYGGARKLGDYNYIQAFIGTQANKLTEAFNAMEGLVQNMPEAEKNFETAKESVLRDIESERITRQDIFWQYESLKRLGIPNDMRRQVYEEVKKMTLADLVAFFNKSIKGSDYTYVLIGRESDLPLDFMKKYGQIQKLDVDYLFNDKQD